MNDLGRYIIRVMENDRIFIRSITTDRSEMLFDIEQVPAFIAADIRNEVFIVNRTRRSNKNLTDFMD